MRTRSDRFVQIVRDESVRSKRAVAKPIHETRNGRRMLIIENLSLSELNERMSTPGGKEEIKKGLMQKFRDSEAVDLALDLLGIAAGLGADTAAAVTVGGVAIPAYLLAAVPDLLNCARHAARGKYIEAGIYFLCAIPIIGDAVGVEKIASESVIKLIQKIRKIGKSAKASKIIPSTIPKFKRVIEKHFPETDSDKIIDTAKTIVGDDAQKLESLLRGELDVSDDEIEDAIGKLASKESGDSSSSDTKQKKSSGTKKDLSESRRIKILIGK